MKLVLSALVMFLLLAANGAAQAPNNLVLTRTFECSQYPQPINFDLVKVDIPITGQRRDGMHTGQRCTGRIGRLEITTAWDGVKVQGGLHNLTVESGFIHCSPVPDEVHQDGVQAMGGRSVTFRNLDIDCGTNSAMFFNTGSGGNNLPTDIVCDGCILRKVSRTNRTVRINRSLRSGVRNSVIYYCGDTCNNAGAVAVGPEAQQPLDQNNVSVLYGQNPPGPVAPQLTICANRATTFDLCWPRLQGVVRFNFYRDQVKVSGSNNGALERVRFGKVVGTHIYGVGAVYPTSEALSAVQVTR